MNPVTYQVVDEIGVITVNNPPVNALSQAVRAGILESVRAAQADESRAILMHFADEVGLDRVLERINEFREQFGDDNWTPAPLLEKLVAGGKSIKEWSES